MPGDILNELRRGGTFDSRGTFSLDARQAREKLRQFQLADPRSYVLELIQVAVLRKATTVEVRADADDMVMKMDGHPFSRHDLSHLYSSIFSQERADEARKILALGLNGAMALGPKSIVVESGSTRLTLGWEREDQIEQLSQPIEGTRIHVKQRFHPARAVDFFRNISGTLPEEVYLRERCLYAPVEINLEGKIISGPRVLPDAWSTISFAHGRGLVGVAPTFTGELRLLKHGVWITTHALPQVRDRLPPQYLMALVEVGHELELDVSLREVVRGETYLRLQERVRRAGAQAWEALIKRRDENEETRRFVGEASAEIFANFDDLHRLEREGLGALLDVPMWPEARGDQPLVSTRALLQAMQQVNAIPYVHEPFRELKPQETPVVLPQSDSGIKIDEALRSCRFQDWSAVLTQARIRQRNQERLQSRRIRPEVPKSARAQVEKAFRWQRFAGKVGLLPYGSQSSIVCIFKGGALEVLRPSWPIGIYAAIEGPFVPNDLWSGAERNGDLAALLLLLFEETTRLLRQADPPPAQLVWRHLVLLSAADAPDALLAQVGFGASEQAHLAEALNEVVRRTLWLELLKDPEHPLCAWPALVAISRRGEVMVSVRELCARSQRGETLLYTNDAALAQEFRKALGEPALQDAIAGELALLVNAGDEELLHQLLPKSLMPLAAHLRELSALRNHLQQRPEALALTAPVWCQTHVSSGPAEGVVGVLDAPVMPDSDRFGRATVRVLSFNRVVQEIDLSLGLGMLVATFNDNQVPPAFTPQDRQRFEDRVRGVLLDAAVKLTEQLCSEWEMGRQPPQLRALLLGMLARSLALAPTHAGARSLSKRLRAIACFPTLAGPPVTYNDLPKDIHYLTAPMKWEGKLPRLVLILDEVARSFLEADVKSRKLHSAKGWLTRERRLRHLEQQPIIEPVLNPTDFLAVHKFELSRGNIRGEIGLPAQSGPLNRGQFQILRGGRDVGVHEMASKYPFVAIADAPKFPVRDDMQFHPVPEWVSRLEEAVERAWLPLIEKLYQDGYRNLGSDGRWGETLLLHAAAYSSQQEEPSPKVKELVAALRRLPLLRTWGGDTISVNALARANPDLSFVPVVPAGWSQPPRSEEHLAVFADRQVVVASEGERAALAILFPDLRDYSQALQEELQKAVYLSRCPGLSTEPPSRPLLLRGYVAKIIRTDLWIPRDPNAPSKVSLGLNGRQVGSVRLSDVFVVEGWATGEAVKLKADLTASLSRGGKSRVEAHAARLYQELARRYLADTLRPDDRPVAEVMLGHAVLGLERRLRQSNKGLPKAAVELHDILKSTPLFTLPGGRKISLHQALSHRPPAFDHWGLWEPASPAQARAEVKRHAPPQAMTLATGVAEAAPWSPSDRGALFLARLRDELSWVHGKLPAVDEAWLSTALWVEQEGRPAATMGAFGLELNRTHPVMRQALEHFERDRVWLSVVASLVFSALNWDQMLVTNEHEAVFTHELASDLVASS